MGDGVAERPILHSGNLSEFLAQLGVKNVTGQDIAPLIQPTIEVGAFADVGQQPAAARTLWSPTLLGGGGQRATFVVLAGPRGSYVEFALSGTVICNLAVGQVEAIEAGRTFGARTAATPTDYRSGPARTSEAFTYQQTAGGKITGIPIQAGFAATKEVEFFPTFIPPAQACFIQTDAAAQLLGLTVLVRDV